MLTKSLLSGAAVNQIFVRRSKKVLVDAPESTRPIELHYVASVAKNLEALGYGMTAALIGACKNLSLSQLTELNNSLIENLSKEKGAHRKFSPMYPGFPQQVMDMADADLYLNALVHYVTAGRYLPGSEPIRVFGADVPFQRSPLIQNAELKPLDLGSVEEFENLFRRIVASNTSLSPQDILDLAQFIQLFGDDTARLLPSEIRHRENKAYIAVFLLKQTTIGESFVQKFCTSATDVLRMAAADSGGDVSLAKATKFRTFSRSMRRMLLKLLERQSNLVEDMLRWKKRWVRLGEKLHPGEFKKSYPKTLAAFDVLRNDLPMLTFNNQIEYALEHRQIDSAVSLLKTRPGDFARRLDHLLRLTAGSEEFISNAFTAVSTKVSTPVLLQVMHHFETRNEMRGLRIFFPKGEMAKAGTIEKELPDLPVKLCKLIVAGCRSALIDRFAKLQALGNCYVDPALANFTVPFSQRSASKSLRTISRGSKLELPDAHTLRLFVWWKNGTHRTDIDLSAAMFDKDFCFVNVITFYDLKNFGGHHSGDIVDAPDGASEFIDIPVAQCEAGGVRYVVMNLNSFTAQPYCDLPECFAGWMARSKPNSGEAYEPKTVIDKLDVSANTKIAIPAIFDLVKGQMIWADLSLTRNPSWNITVAGNLTGLQLSLKSMVELNKPNLYDLMCLHSEARGNLVSERKDAATIFSADTTPFDLTKIASEFMCG